MKYLLVLTISFCFSLQAMAQSYLTQAKPYGEKLWGYIDQNGESVISAKYKKCYKFSSSGFAPIYESKKFSLIDKKGTPLTTDISGYVFLEKGGMFGSGAQGFSDGLISVGKNKKWGYMNTSGKLVIDFKYDQVSQFENGFAIVKSGSTVSVINTQGDKTDVPVAGIQVSKPFSGGLASYRASNEMWGFINTQGMIAIEAQFISVGIFRNGMAWAKTINKRIGYINETGSWVIEPRFDIAKNFDPTSGLARIKENDRWGYTNSEGEISFVNITLQWNDFSDGLAKGRTEQGIGFYNAKGEWAIKPIYEGVRAFKNGFAAVKKNGKWGFIDKSGKLVIETKFATVKDMELVD